MYYAISNELKTQNICIFHVRSWYVGTVIGVPCAAVFSICRSARLLYYMTVMQFSIACSGALCALIFLQLSIYSTSIAIIHLCPSLSRSLSRSLSLTLTTDRCINKSKEFSCTYVRWSIAMRCDSSLRELAEKWLNVSIAISSLDLQVRAKCTVNRRIASVLFLLNYPSIVVGIQCILIIRLDPILFLLVLFCVVFFSVSFFLSFWFIVMLHTQWCNWITALG